MDKEQMMRELNEKMQDLGIKSGYALTRCEQVMTDESTTIFHKLFAAFLHLITRGAVFIGTCMVNYMKKKYDLEG